MDAVKTLDSLIKSKAHVRDVNLEYSGIDDKSLRGAVFPRLKQLGEIETLDLSRTYFFIPHSHSHLFSKK